jgi:hypothetical protein
MRFSITQDDNLFVFKWYNNEVKLATVAFSIKTKKTDDNKTKLVRIKIKKARKAEDASMYAFEESCKRSIWALVEYLLTEFGQQKASSVMMVYKPKNPTVVTGPGEWFLSDVGFNLNKRKTVVSLKDVLENEIMNAITSKMVKRDMQTIKESLKK